MLRLLSGAILQSITRNPLAEPGLLGVSAGGVLAVVILIVFQAGRDSSSMIDSGLLLPLAALVGGLITGSLAYLLSWKDETDPVRLVLTGVLIGGLCSAFTSVLLLWANEYQMMRIVRWTIGSTAGMGSLGDDLAGGAGCPAAGLALR